MNRIKRFVQWAWTRVSIARYRHKQSAMARQNRDAVERVEHQENGGSPYGPPPMSGGGGM